MATLKRKLNWFTVAALMCTIVLTVMAFLGLLGIVTVGTGYGIFVIGVGFNGVIAAVLSLHDR